MTVIIRGKLNKNNEWTDEQVIFRGPPELYTTVRLALRPAVPVRS